MPTATPRQAPTHQGPGSRQTRASPPLSTSGGPTMADFLGISLFSLIKYQQHTCYLLYLKDHTQKVKCFRKQAQHPVRTASSQYTFKRVINARAPASRLDRMCTDGLAHVLAGHAQEEARGTTAMALQAGRPKADRLQGCRKSQGKLSACSSSLCIAK